MFYQWYQMLYHSVKLSNAPSMTTSTQTVVDIKRSTNDTKFSTNGTKLFHPFPEGPSGKESEQNLTSVSTKAGSMCQVLFRFFSRGLSVIYQWF